MWLAIVKKTVNVLPNPSAVTSQFPLCLCTMWQSHIRDVET
jgi:hypothetical protein